MSRAFIIGLLVFCAFQLFLIRVAVLDLKGPPAPPPAPTLTRIANADQCMAFWFTGDPQEKYAAKERLCGRKKP